MDDLAQAERIASQLEGANRSARLLFGERYELKVEPWRDVVRKLAKNWDCRVAEVPPRLHREGNMPENPLLLLAAVVDVMREA